MRIWSNGPVCLSAGYAFLSILLQSLPCHLRAPFPTFFLIFAL